MRALQFSVTPEVLELGVIIRTARISGFHNHDRSPALQQFITTILEEVRERWGDTPYRDDPTLGGFRELHTKVGRSNRDYVASPENLRRLWLTRSQFPAINPLVDLYNAISLQSGLALGAHDVRHIQGDVTLRLTSGDERFVPLGTTEAAPVFPGEYAYVDADQNVICRLEVLQVEPTKVTEHTTDAFLIIQGNSVTPAATVETTRQLLCEQIEKFLGGTSTFLN